MRIKNKRGLTRRVNSNIREDKLVNDTYADMAIKKGKKKPRAEVCGIGCLGLPHTIRERLAFYANSHQIGQYGFVGEDELIENMGEEFGISPALALLLEALFVPNRREGIKSAERFLRGFVRHLPEGVDISEQHVKAFCRRVGLVTQPARYGDEQKRASFTIVWPEEHSSNTDELTAALFAWFDAGARVTKMAAA